MNPWQKLVKQIEGVAGVGKEAAKELQKEVNQSGLTESEKKALEKT